MQSCTRVFHTCMQSCMQSGTQLAIPYMQCAVHSATYTYGATRTPRLAVCAAHDAHARGGSARATEPEERLTWMCCGRTPPPASCAMACRSRGCGPATTRCETSGTATRAGTELRPHPSHKSLERRSGDYTAVREKHRSHRQILDMPTPSYTACAHFGSAVIYVHTA